MIVQSHGRNFLLTLNENKTKLRGSAEHEQCRHYFLAHSVRIRAINQVMLHYDIGVDHGLFPVWNQVINWINHGTSLLAHQQLKWIKFWRICLFVKVKTRNADHTWATAPISTVNNCCWNNQNFMKWKIAQPWWDLNINMICFKNQVKNFGNDRHLVQAFFVN